MRLFVLTYYILVCLVHLLGIPFLFVLSFKEKYKNSLKRRFFIPEAFKSKKEVHWFHACSFGEVRALSNVILKLQKHKDCEILLTTTTQTGYKLALELFDKRCVRYLPFESFIPFFVGRLKIKTLTLFEAELWLMLLYYAKKIGAKTYLLNARISLRSYPKYLRFKFFYHKLFSLLDIIYAQSLMDKKRLLALGATKIEVFGNLKAMERPNVTKEYPKPSKSIIIVASSHAKDNKSEEEEVLKEILKWQELNPDNKERFSIIFAPRHPERFLEVENKLNIILQEANKEKIAKLSKEDLQSEREFYLLDCLGELNNYYAISDLVILCGSFLQGIGGHNPIEPAYFGARIISGAYIFNQKTLFSNLQGYVICKIEDLKVVLQNWENIPNAIIKNKQNLDTILKNY
ncbi:lipid IV(A) 3-deoxy-D-manno-octulosonic acid transferase [Helicobacter burdigaliensis]|uniref:lipid IV(A) 3-deoxy-D-manno-octulosonic acid transferase n=1 Tax=Helicobacter burdigaliensis TaxID=2315334 RepID=UPI000EF661AF|nr:lipid IV(A) 3-deoxy-D-manno-octulosonic acid transferase [Helicobacter burdigaliensis]